MSNPFIPFDPPGDTTNRTAKMLSARARKIVNGEPIPPTGTAKIMIPPEDLTFRAASRFGMRWNAQPAGLTLYFTAQRRKYNSSAYNQIRLGADIVTAGASTAYVLVMYTATPLDINSWRHPGRGGAPVRLPLADAGPFVTIEAELDNAARQDVWWGIFGMGGDGVLSPVLGIVYVQFLLGEVTPRRRWYWRDFAPSISISGSTALADLITANGFPNTEDFWGPQGRSWANWVAPADVAAVLASPRIFKRGKGTTLTGQQFGTDPGPSDSNNHTGPVFAIVGPPLKAQTIPAFDYQTGWVGVGGAGCTACWMFSQLLIWRESDDTIVRASSITVSSNGTWFRYIPRNRVHGLSMDPATTLEGDRYVLWGCIPMEMAGGSGCSITGTMGIGASIGYNGGTEIPDEEGDASSYWMYAASYTDFPATLQFVTEDA